MAHLLVNRTFLRILVVMLTCHILPQRVGAGPSLQDNNDSTHTKAINFTVAVPKEKNIVRRIITGDNMKYKKRGWEAIELNRHKRDDSITANWKQREMDRDATHWAKLNENKMGTVKAYNSKWGWKLLSNQKRGWDGIDFPWGKRSEKEDFPKQKWNSVNVLFGKQLSNDNKDSHQEWGSADNTMKKASSEKSQAQKQQWDSVDVSRKRGWDGVDFLFDTHKDPNRRGWGGGDFSTGKRSGDREAPKRGWDGVDFTLVNHSADKESQKRGWDGVDFTFKKRSNGIESNKKDLDSVDFTTEKRSNEKESHKRGWDGVDFPFGRRSDGSYSKQDWEGMDLVLGVGLDTHRAMREKRGWEGLNLHYRVINAHGPSQSSDYHKRGWEGVDTCVCCHSNHRVLCCLSCNRGNDQPKPRLTTKSYKDMFYVRDTVCKCCYATKVKDCCDLCEVMS